MCRKIFSHFLLSFVRSVCLPLLLQVSPSIALSVFPAFALPKLEGRSPQKNNAAWELTRPAKRKLRACRTTSILACVASFSPAPPTIGSEHWLVDQSYAMAGGAGEGAAEEGGVEANMWNCPTSAAQAKLEPRTEVELPPVPWQRYLRGVDRCVREWMPLGCECNCVKRPRQWLLRPGGDWPLLLGHDDVPSVDSPPAVLF